MTEADDLAAALEFIFAIGVMHRVQKCHRGHSMEDALVRKSGTRNCRVCQRMRDRAYKARRRAEEREKGK